MVMVTLEDACVDFHELSIQCNAKLTSRKFYCHRPACGTTLSVTALISLVTLIFDLLTSKYVLGLSVWWASILPILGFLYL